MLAAATVAVSVATGGRLANPLVAASLTVVAAVAVFALLRDRTGVGVAAVTAVLLVGWLSAVVWASSLTGVVQVVLALVAALLLLSIVYGVTEGRRRPVLVLAAAAWITAIVVGALVFDHAIDWRYVTTPSQCGNAAVVIGPPSKSTAATSRSVLCIEKDGQLFARLLAGITAVALVGAGVAFVWIGIVRRWRRKRADAAVPLYDRAGNAVTWRTKRAWETTAFVDDDGGVVAWLHRGAVVTAAGAHCGWYAEKCVRDTVGRPVAWEADARDWSAPPRWPGRTPQPAGRPKRPDWPSVPGAPTGDATESPLRWRDLRATPITGA
jgi:hypothetical protein